MFDGGGGGGGNDRIGWVLFKLYATKLQGGTCNYMYNKVLSICLLRNTCCIGLHWHPMYM